MLYSIVDVETSSLDGLILMSSIFNYIIIISSFINKFEQVTTLD
jgi:hypothetical protein